MTGSNQTVRPSATPHLQLGGPKYQQVIDADAKRLNGQPPDMEAVYNLLQHIAQDLHEVKLRQKK